MRKKKMIEMLILAGLLAAGCRSDKQPLTQDEQKQLQQQMQKDQDAQKKLTGGLGNSMLDDPNHPQKKNPPAKPQQSPQKK